MKREFFLYHLTPTEFENLVLKISKRWLGQGTIPFAEGKDGGRDARFNGTAQDFPSIAEPWNGHVVIQAKHTVSPGASCSNSAFKKYFLLDQDGNPQKDSELPKIKTLVEEEVLDYYLVFTNRKLTAGSDLKMLKEMKKQGAKDAAIIGLEKINDFLSENPDIADALPTAHFDKPFDFLPDDMVDVIHAVSEVIPITGSEYHSQTDFEAVSKKKVKNKTNKMSEEYYRTVVVNQNMPLFHKFKAFLENERNREYREIYHDIADELRQKIVINRGQFDFFEEIIVYLLELIKSARPDLRTKRRYVTFLLCYMYFDCDIGEREPVE